MERIAMGVCILMVQVRRSVGIIKITEKIISEILKEVCNCRLKEFRTYLRYFGSGKSNGFI